MELKIMKKLSYFAYPLVAVLSLAAAGAAFADEITPDHTADVPSLKTRAQVYQELLQARADGSTKVYSMSYNPLFVTKSVKTRAEVKGDRDRSYASTFYREDSGSFALSTQRQPHAAQSIYAVK